MGDALGYLTTTAWENPFGNGNATAREIDDAALADESFTAGWLAYGRTYSEQRFSPLRQVNASIGPSGFSSVCNSF